MTCCAFIVAVDGIDIHRTFGDTTPGSFLRIATDAAGSAAGSAAGPAARSTVDFAGDVADAIKVALVGTVAFIINWAFATVIGAAAASV